MIKQESEKESDMIICSYSSHTVQYKDCGHICTETVHMDTQTHTNKQSFPFAHTQQLTHPHADAHSVDLVSYFCPHFRVSQRRAEC